MKFHFAAFIILSAFTARGAEVITLADLPATRLRFGSITFYTENDKYLAGTDRNYTNGFKLSFLTTDLQSLTADPVPHVLQRLARSLGALVPPGRDYKLGLALGQNIYTPTDTDTPAYQPRDRPYAAWLYASAAFQIYRAPRAFASGWRAVGRLDTVDVTIGMVGPGALGRQAQNNFHDVIGAAHANGWPNQIHNEPGLELGYERKYRIATPRARDGWGADLIPHAGVTVGNIFAFANLGAEVRAGWKLPADFGTNLIRPSGDSNSRRRPNWSAFAFAAVDGRAVARDVTLQGNSFRASADIGHRPFVGDLLVGFAFGTRHWQISYSEAARSHEFTGQPQRSVFGSISVTFYY